MEHKLLIGNTVVYPETIKNFLKKSHYWVSFKEEGNTMELWANHRKGGEILLSIKNCSYIQAKEFSELLGLEKSDGGGCSWGKWNPIYGFDDDGSKDAERIKICAFKLGIPLVIFAVTEKQKWAFYHHQYVQRPPDWTVERIIAELKDWAVQYKKELSTVP